MGGKRCTGTGICMVLLFHVLKLVLHVLRMLSNSMQLKTGRWHHQGNQHCGGKGGNGRSNGFVHAACVRMDAGVRCCHVGCAKGVVS